MSARRAQKYDDKIASRAESLLMQSSPAIFRLFIEVQCWVNIKSLFIMYKALKICLDEPFFPWPCPKIAFFTQSARLRPAFDSTIISGASVDCGRATKAHFTHSMNLFANTMRLRLLLSSFARATYGNTMDSRMVLSHLDGVALVRILRVCRLSMQSPNQ